MNTEKFNCSMRRIAKLDSTFKLCMGLHDLESAEALTKILRSFIVQLYKELNNEQKEIVEQFHGWFDESKVEKAIEIEKARLFVKVFSSTKLFQKELKRVRFTNK